MQCAARRPKRLPVVLSRDEVRRLLAAVAGSHGLYRLMSGLMYGSGLRLMECCRLTYAAGLIQCGHCGHQITGELKFKKTKSGERSYSYYFCTHYRTVGHPRARVTELELDRQFLGLFDKMRIEDEQVRDWFRTILVLQTENAQSDSTAQRAELQRQASLLVAQQDRLLNLHLVGDIDQLTFATSRWS